MIVGVWNLASSDKGGHASVKRPIMNIEYRTAEYRILK